MIKVHEFCEKIGITEAQFYGEEKITRALTIDKVRCIPPNFSPNVTKSLYIGGRITYLPNGFRATVGGSLHIDNVTHIEGDFDVTVGYYLQLNDVVKISSKFKGTIGTLHAPLLREIPDGFSCTVIDKYWLSNVTYIPEDFAPTVSGSIYLNKLVNIPKGFAPTCDYLHLPHVTHIGAGFKPTVYNSMYLCSLESIDSNTTWVVGCDLELQGVTHISSNVSLVVGQHLTLPSLKHLPKDLKLVVGGTANLNSVKELYDGIELTIGRNLELDSLVTIPKNSKIIVGDALYLGSIKTIPKKFRPMVGFSIYHSLYNYTWSKCKIIERWEELQLISWGGKYIQVDGILGEVVHERNGVYKCKHITRGNKIMYVISDGKGCYAHGDTINDARVSLEYKIGYRDSSKYDGLSLDSVLSHDDAIVCYRIITGACQYGTKYFIDDVLKDGKKDSYTIQEIIDLTNGQYGHTTFKRYFNNKKYDAFSLDCF